jgi:cobalt-zinc-cadmium efflux system membrane fusion protein
MTRSSIVLSVAAAAALAAAAYLTRGLWIDRPAPPSEEPAPAAGGSDQVELSEPAQKNLRLTAEPLRATTYWKTLAVPGLVIDRPGHSDRGVIAPAAAVVARVHRLPGETVRPGETLFTLRLLSESVQLSQTELFRAAQDIKLAQAERQRLAPFRGASVSETQMIDVENRIARLETTAKAVRQELLNRGLSLAQLEGVAEGKFVAEIPVVAPAAADHATLELQDLKVDLGQQVQAGQTLGFLADHHALAIEGRAFRDELPLIERSVRAGWPVEVDFREGTGDWPALGQTFHIQQVASVIDPDTRTFGFVLPLDNQSRALGTGDRPRLLWRFRPGQRVRLRVRTEKLDNVFVVPAEAVVREGAETYLFRRSGDTFTRRPVHVVHQDAREAVIANDGSMLPGVYVAQTGAAALNRMLKAQTGTAPKGFHVHADGSVHMNH